MFKVLIISIGEYEMAVSERAMSILREFSIEAEQVNIPSDGMVSKIEDIYGYIENSTVSVIIATAGEMPNLPSIIASRISQLVIAIPIKSTLLNGLDSLIAAVKVPVGCTSPAVAIDGGENAGLLAAQILAISDKDLAEKLKEYKLSMKEHVRKQNMKLKEEHNL